MQRCWSTLKLKCRVAMLSIKYNSHACSSFYVVIALHASSLRSRIITIAFHVGRLMLSTHLLPTLRLQMES
jgi:hypothetical protein